MQANNVMKKVILCVIGSGILAFGLYNIHALSGVTEGGVLGMTLLLNHWPVSYTHLTLPTKRIV